MQEEESDIIRIPMETGCNLQRDIMTAQQVRQPFAVMERIALARVEEVHARIMVVWRDGINVINILLCQKSEFQE